MKLFQFILAIAINSSLLIAQTPISSPRSAFQNMAITNHLADSHACGFDLVHERLLQMNPEYAARVQANEQAISQLLKNKLSHKAAGVDTIPVVVHIIHTGQSVGSGANISLAQIYSAIDTLNGRYKNSNGQGVDVEMHFELAKRDPNGNATSGIVRINGSSVSGYSAAGVNVAGTTGASEIAIKDLSRWPNTQYYNIWVVTEFDNNNGGSGYQGFAYFPGASPVVDGTMILNSSFGTTGTVLSWKNKNRTMVHELGHGLNLYHTFQGDNDGTTCPTGNGDFVADTDPHIRASSNCPTGINSCTNNSIDDETANFMNYSNQSCSIKFTTGQKTRMTAGLEVSRPSLTTSLGNKAPSSLSVVAAVCTPSTSNTSNNFGLGIYGFDLANFSIVSDGTVDEGDYIDHTKHQIIELKSDTSYPISITTGQSNAENVKAFIDFNNDGDFADAGETVFSSTNAINHSGSISIPSSGFVGNSLLRMRVISDFVNFTITNSCFNSNYGQIEDYAIRIEEPLAVNIGVNAISCWNINDGVLIANINGGNSPYTYAWSNSATTSIISNLNSGSYTITVTDNNGNTASATETLTSPASILINLSTTNVSCNGNSDGSINAIATGGVNPIIFNWSSGPSSANITGLAAGTYTVTATDANGCTSIASSTINQPSTLNISLTSNNVSCGNTSDGSITSSVSGGSNPYTYNWSNASSASQLSNISAGSYTLTLTDANGCNQTSSTVVSTDTCISAVTLSLRSFDCGSANVDPLNQQIVSNTNPNATSYRFRFNGGSLNNFVLNTGAAFYFYTNQVTGLTYGTTYSVEVSAFIGGSWTNYGAPCNITTSSIVGAINMRLRPFDCGATNVDPLNRQILSNSRADATAYRFRFNGGSLNNFVLNTGAAFFFITNQVPGLTYGTTYSVEVAALVNGSWSNYGTSCNISTSSIASAVNMRLRSFDCGATNVDPLNRQILSNSRADATAYRFRINGGSLNNFVLNTGSAFYFVTYQVPGLTYGTTYSIEVAAFINGSWTNYGTPCNISTSSVANAVNMKLRSFDCGATNVDLLNRQLLTSNRADATAFRFRINGGSLNNFVLNTGSAFYFLTSQVPGLAVSTTYSVEVAAFINGSWTNYGTPCNITTSPVMSPSANLRLARNLSSSDLDLGQSEVGIYPNPFSGNNNSLRISYKSLSNEIPHVEISIYSTEGKLIYREQKNLEEGIYQGKLERDIFPSTGIYFINVQEGKDSYVEKIIVQ